MEGIPERSPTVVLTRPTRPAVDVLGMRRITFVMVEQRPEGSRCSVVGVAHRIPVVRPVPLRTAAALAAAGVPTVVRADARATSPELAGVEG